MSVSTPSPMTELMQRKLRETFGEPVAHDDRTALYDHPLAATQQQGGDLARAQGEPVTVTLHDPDEVVTFSDGRQYQASPSGWRRIDPERPTPKEQPDHE